jgi:hypothetical protein
MTDLEQARKELQAFLFGDRFNHPDPDEFMRLLDRYVQAVIAEQMQSYQRKPLRFD